MVYVFLAEGFEELEALAPVDMLRRARVDVRTVKVGEGSPQNQSKVWEKLRRAIEPDLPDDYSVTSARNIELMADINIASIDLDNLEDLEMIVLPGGLPGTDNLYACEKLGGIIDYCVKNNIKIGAICAAPSILARRGYLKNIRATAFPAFRHWLEQNGARLEPEQRVVTDGIFTTADGVLSSINFAIELVRVLKGSEWAESIGTDKPAPNN